MTLTHAFHAYSRITSAAAALAISLAGVGMAEAAKAPQRSSLESDSDTGSGSLITYMTREHDAYHHYSDVRLEPAFEAINGNQVYWDIEADDEAHADRLASHVEFMAAALESGAYPREWDKFFIIDAAMHAHVHTDVRVDGRRVQIVKEADNACAYSIILAHAGVVSSEFFATGDVSTDHSSVADEIIASVACADFRDYLEAEVAEHWEPR